MQDDNWRSQRKLLEDVKKSGKTVHISGELVSGEGSGDRTGPLQN